MFTPNQLSTVQGFLSSAVNDALGSSLVGVKELFRTFSFDILCNDALHKRQLFSLEKFQTTIEGETFIPEKFRYKPISYQRLPKLEKDTDIILKQTNINIKLKELISEIVADCKYNCA